MTTQLGDLQHAIMRVLWRRGTATAAEVHRELLPERGLAPTTIATMLSKMEKKGVVEHTTKGRSYVYSAVVSEPEVQRSMLGELTDRLFGGSASALVSHLVTEHDIDPQELAELKREVDRAARRATEARRKSETGPSQDHGGNDG